ncbi:hypothetical protein [Spirillospora sp. CA-294931]|uniref:hypothetical protein n=1 Tax=Spirillospora sp. CA-294931 TaxID=3240042 RepID=UPI003D92580F
MTPTLEGRLQTRIFLAATVGVLWTLVITPVLPIPAGVTAGMSTMGMRYSMAFAGLLLMTVYGLVWEHLYHRLQQRRWDRDWPSLFALLTVLNEAPVVWLLALLFFPVMAGPTPDMLTVHDGGIAGPLPGMSDPTPDMYGQLDTSGSLGLDSPYLPAFTIHIVTTWVVMWLFSQGLMRTIFVRWRFEGGRIVHSRIPDSAPPGDRPEQAPPVGGNGSEAGPRQALTGPAAAGRAFPSRAARARPNGLPASASNDDLVEGGRCGHGHFGYPGLRYCMVCGRPLSQLNGTRALGRRPPVGILIFDDGATHVLDGDIRLALVEGQRTVTVGRDDEIPAASALADIRLDGWHPAVSSESHPIVVSTADGEDGLRVEPGASVRLTPGAEFTVATHWVRYESPYPPAEPDLAARGPRAEAVPEVGETESLTATTPPRPGVPR